MGAHSVNYCLTIMKTILVLACVVLASAKHIHVKIDQLEYGFCDGSAEPASIDAASVEPFPIVVATGETITLSVQITLNEVVPAGAQVSLKIKKEGLIPVPIPCLEIDGLHIGSCDYDGDHLLELGPLPEIPSIIGDLLASGTYYADATITLADGTQMACLYVRVELAGH